MVVALILAGGRGERFWPKSRRQSPKHLLNLYGNQTLLEQTIKRLKGVVGDKDIWVMTNKDQTGLIKKFWKGNILVEPEGRNTAAAIGLAAVKVKKIYGPKTIMLVVSADHWIGKLKEFKDALRRGIELAGREKALVSIGVKAVRAETGFGYIEKSRVYTDIPRSFKVKRFVEKPDLTRAKRFCRSSRYLWNSGIFVWKVEEIFASFGKYLPTQFKRLSQIEHCLGQPNKEKSIEDIYHRIKKVSIDCGIMEKAGNVWVVEGKFLWEDVGSWTAWAKLRKADASQNVIKGEVIAIDTDHSIIWTDKNLVAVLGVKDLVIVAEKDSVLVCHRSRVQEIKKILARMHTHKKWKQYV